MMMIFNNKKHNRRNHDESIAQHLVSVNGHSFILQKFELKKAVILKFTLPGNALRIKYTLAHGYDSHSHCMNSNVTLPINSV